MVAEFTDINRGMEKTGTFTMKRKKLFQLVGKANSNLADVILKLGLFERLPSRSYLRFSHHFFLFIRPIPSGFQFFDPFCSLNSLVLLS